MPKKLYKILPLLLATFFMFQTNISQASHLMGGDLTYVCNGNGKYALDLRLFRDCNGISLSSTALVTVSSPSCNYNQTITLQNFGVVNVATPLCSTEPDACTTPFGGGATYGIEEWIYRGQITVPVGCGTDWTFSWSSCCRNSAITTLQSPGGEGFFISARMNNTLNPCNTAPAFNTEPAYFLCANQTNHYNGGVADAFGDSLVYSLVDCLDGPNNPVVYSAGYSGIQPLSGQVILDPQSGEMTLTPNITQIGVLCLKVEEYRNNVKIGEVNRDLQFVVESCNNNTLPIVSGFNGTADSTGLTGSYTLDVCAGNPIDVDINAFDHEVAGYVPGHKVTDFRWNNSILGANFIADFTGVHPTANFVWTPTDSDVGSHQFLVSIEDNGCPAYGKNIYTFNINVIPNNVSLDLTVSDTLISIDKDSLPVTVQLNANTNVSATAVYNWSLTTHPSLSWSCTNCPDPMVTISDSGSYNFVVRVNDPATNCSRRGEVNFSLDAFTDVNQIPTVLSEVSVFPNPSNGNTTLSYNLDNASNVSIEVFDAIGRQVSLITEGYQNAGEHKYQLAKHLTDKGIYLVRLNVDGETITKKILVH